MYRSGTFASKIHVEQDLILSSREYTRYAVLCAAVYTRVYHVEYRATYYIPCTKVSKFNNHQYIAWASFLSLFSVVVNQTIHSPISPLLIPNPSHPPTFCPSIFCVWAVSTTNCTFSTWWFLLSWLNTRVFQSHSSTYKKEWLFSRWLIKVRQTYTSTRLFFFTVTLLFFWLPSPSLSHPYTISKMAPRGRGGKFSKPTRGGMCRFCLHVLLSMQWHFADARLLDMDINKTDQATFCRRQKVQSWSSTHR